MIGTKFFKAENCLYKRESSTVTSKIIFVLVKMAKILKAKTLTTKNLKNYNKDKWGT